MDDNQVRLAIGVDLDDVCYSFILAFIHFLVEHKGFDPDDLPYPKTWDVHEEWNMDIQTWLDLFAEGVDSGIIFLHGGPFDGAVEVLTRLREQGHSIHIVTHRMVGDLAVQNTMEWLQREGLPYDTLTFAKDKTVIKTDIFIEDSVANWENLWMAGTEAYLITRPHNEDYDTSFRVASWEEFEQVVARKVDHIRESNSMFMELNGA